MPNGHLDTIPVGTYPSVRRKGNRVYGRWTTDMKEDMAAVMGAVKALLKCMIELQGDLWLPPNLDAVSSTAPSLA